MLMTEKTAHGGKRTNAGRLPLPPEKRMVAKPIDLPQSMWNNLASIAERYGKPRNAYIRSVLQHAIDLDLQAAPE